MDDPERDVHDASRGDARALEAVMERHLSGLRAFVRLRMGRLLLARESVSDIVQSACREVLRDLPSYRYQGESAFRQWLYTAALRKLVDRHRFHRARRRDAGREVALRGHEDASAAAALDSIFEDQKTPARIAAGREDLARLEHVFDRLPGRYRDVILASRVLGRSHAEIARDLDTSEGAVRVLLSRALARLAELLERSGG